MGTTNYPALIQAVCEYLRGKGFRRRSLGFNRPGPDGECFEGVTIQRTARTYEERRFTIEVGVYVPKIEALRHPELAAQVKFPQAWDGTFRERLPLLAGWKDHWWPSEKTSDFKEISSLFEQYGFPFLDRWNSMEKILAGYERGLDRDKIGNSIAACALYLSGKIDEAREELLRLQADFRARGVSSDYSERLAERMKITL